MIPFTEKSVEAVFGSYPEIIQEKMLALRDLIYTTSQKSGTALSEALKWGEPSYLCKDGSTLRIDWKESDQDFYRMFFHCQTSLVSTFRKVYPDDFCYEENRAIRFNLSKDPDLGKLACCIEAALKYHLVKDTPDLGLTNA